MISEGLTALGRLGVCITSWFSPPPARLAIPQKVVRVSLGQLPPSGFGFSNNSYCPKFSSVLTKSNGVTAEAGGGHDDLVQRFLVAEHLEDLPGKWGGPSTLPA